MDHEIDPLGDPLDRDLEALLAVEPSPEFLAQVRTRIAEEPAPSAWRWNLRFALAGSAAAVVLAAFAMSWTARIPQTAVPQQTIAREDVRLETEPELVRLKPDTTEEIPNGRVRGGRLQAARSDTGPFAEVIFSEEERRALVALVAAVEEGRVPPFPAAPTVDADALPDGTAMMIEPLVIEPLPQIARLEE